jgi:hypothetical protein
VWLLLIFAIKGVIWNVATNLDHMLGLCLQVIVVRDDLSYEGLTYVWNDGAYSSAWCEVSPVQGDKVLACTHFYSHPGLLFMAGHSGNKCC